MYEMCYGDFVMNYILCCKEDTHFVNNLQHSIASKIQLEIHQVMKVHNCLCK